MPAFSRFLRYFVVVGRLGSIRKAAEILNVSASAIDRQILNVEADIGIPLFERLPTGLRLTAAGEIMVRSFVEIVLGFVTPVGHPFASKNEVRFSASVGLALIVPAEPLAVWQQIAVLEGMSA